MTYTCTLGGVEYTLPNPADLKGEIPPEVEADYIIDPDDEMAATRFFLSLFRAACRGDRGMWKALNAHRDEWASIAQSWMEHYTDGGVTFPEGSGSVGSGDGTAEPSTPTFAPASTSGSLT